MGRQGITLYKMLSFFAGNYELWATIRATNGFWERIFVAGDFNQRRLLYKLETLCLGKEIKNIRRKIFRFYDGYGADGGSRTHATVSCPKAFRVLPLTTT